MRYSSDRILGQVLSTGFSFYGGVFIVNTKYFEVVLHNIYKAVFCLWQSFQDTIEFQLFGSRPVHILSPNTLQKPK